MTHLEFLNDMVEYYSTDTSRRSVNNTYGSDICMYRTSNGQKCAIGRYIPDGKYSPSIEGLSPDSERLLCLLPEEIKALDIEFLLNCQSFHDKSGNWGVNNLTEEGQDGIDNLRKLAVKLDKEFAVSL